MECVCEKRVVWKKFELRMGVARGITMKDNPVRVLHVLGTTNLGGAESRVMELYRAINKERVQFDFLVHTDTQGHYDKEIQNLGGSIYHVPRFKGINYLAYRKALTDFFREHHDYVAVQGHMTSTASIYLPIAKQAGIPVTIAHARSAGVDRAVKGLLTKILRRSLKKKADYCFTCSAKAAEAVYGKGWVQKGNVWTIPNAIDAKRFEYNIDTRKQIRSVLNVSDKFVVGHVGRFGFMKNHAYVLDVFGELCKKRADAVLILIGTGTLEEEMKAKAKAMGLEDKIQFLGNHSDVECYYQAFDYFVFPSFFEGFPGSVLEAQAAGLHCLVSDHVTREVALTELVSYRSIEEPAAVWANEIAANSEQHKTRESKSAQIIEKGFDVRQQAAKMEAFYISGKNPPGKKTEI